MRLVIFKFTPKTETPSGIPLTYLQLLMLPKGSNGKLGQKEVDALRHWPLRQRLLYQQRGWLQELLVQALRLPQSPQFFQT